MESLLEHSFILAWDQEAALVSPSLPKENILVIISLSNTNAYFSGNRFALMEIKAILYNLLLHFSFEPNEQSDIPMKLMKNSFVLVAENGVHLELKPRKNGEFTEHRITS